MRKRFTFLAACAFLAFSLPAVAQNSALRLDSTNYVSSSTFVVNPNGAFTIEFWAYIDSAINDGHMHQFVSEGFTEYGLGFYIGYDFDSTIVIGDSWGHTGVPMPTRQWTHIAVTNSSSGDIKLYLNGVLKGTSSSFIFTNSSIPFRIGVQTDTTQNIIARMDELKTWNVERSAFNIKTDMFSSPDLSDPDLQTWYQMDDMGSLTVLNSAANTGSSQDGTIFGDGTSAPNSWVSSPVVFNSNGLTFNGTDKTQVIIPNNGSYDQIRNGTGAGGTVEFWVWPSTLSGSYSTVLGSRGRYSFLLSENKIGIDNGTTVNTLTLDPNDFPTGFPTDNWHHLAFVYDGIGKTVVYYDGFPLTDYITGNDFVTGSFGTATNQPLTLGIARDVSNNDIQPFTGGIDEVRLWTIQQTPMDVFSNMNSTLTGLETGLIGQFSFDEGVPGQDNTGLVVALDNAAGNHGMLTNFQLNGSVSNFNSHPLTSIPLPVTLAKFTALRSNAEAILKWQTAQEQNTRDFTIERSPDGKAFTTIGVVPAAGNSSNSLNYSFTDLAPAKGNNYYRLKQSDLDDKFTYSPLRLLNFASTGRLIWYVTGRLSAEVYLQQGNNESYILSDISGHILRQGQLSSGKTGISHLPAGVYIIKVMTSSGSVLIAKIFLI